MSTSIQILIADDNRDDVVLLTRAMREVGAEGITVHHVMDGEGAIKQISGTENLGLLVLDHYLPKKTGLEVLHWLHEQNLFPNCPVVALTSHIATVHAREFIHAGAVDVMIKPMDWDGYLQLAAQLIALCHGRPKSSAHVAGQSVDRES